MSEAAAMPSHDDLADMLLALGALLPPAELHGYISGQLAVGARLSEPEWLSEVQAFLDCEAPNPDQVQLLRGLYRATLTQLEDGQMELTLVLPEDDFDLDLRVESLGHWCQGFLAGFALAGKRRHSAEGQQPYSDDVGETLSDLAAIAQVGLEGVDDEESESHFFAICEYVRMAALNIFLECNEAPAAGAAPGPSGKQRLH